MANATQRLESTERLAETFDWMAERYLWQTRLVSWGRYEGWQQQLAAVIAQFHPESLVDIGCGPGGLLRRLAYLLPECRLVAIDISDAMLARIPPDIAVEKYHLPLASWAPEHPGQFDAAVLSFALRDMPDWPAAIQEAARVLRPGGHLFILETHTPEGASAMGFRWYFLRALPRLGERVLAKDWPGPREDAPYRWLANTHREWDRGRDVPDWLEAAGLENLESYTHPRDVVALWSAEKPKA